MATTGPALAQEQRAPHELQDPTGMQVRLVDAHNAPYQGDTAGLTLPPGENNVIEVGGTPAHGAGHATDSSNNTHGDIYEWLSNQKATEDDESNSGGQPNT